MQFIKLGVVVFGLLAMGMALSTQGLAKGPVFMMMGASATLFVTYLVMRFGLKYQDESKGGLASFLDVLTLISGSMVSLIIILAIVGLFSA